MAGSTLGTIFQITTWGESHGSGIGVIVDGCPAGLALSESDIQPYLNRRRPGRTPYASGRMESDQVTILSGVFEGQTTGTPISLMVKNKNQVSTDYNALANVYRPGHADYTYDCKYGIRDYRGGGRSSGRETIGRVAGGAIALKILYSLGIQIITYTKSIGPITVPESDYSYAAIHTNPLCMPSELYTAKAIEYLNECMKNQNSSGGVIECRIQNVPAGMGEPVFDKLDANLAKAILSIGAVKGFEIGDGFKAAANTGIQNNDFFRSVHGSVSKCSNHGGGIFGGISDGSEIIFRASVKPSPSIGVCQQTVTSDGSNVNLSISGRHDPIIVPRAVVVVESMAALTLVDSLFLNMSSRMDGILKFYQ